MTTLKERMDELPVARRKKVEVRAAALIAEEMSLRDLRKARKKTQVRVAKELGIKQENVSRIEKRADLLISTLSGYVEAMGGRLHLVAEFPDRPSVELTGIAALENKSRSSKR
jgi:DNA-binding XRE family transcriptional regulator